MSAAERIEAAITKLETLRGNSGPWSLAGGNEWIFPIGITVASDDGGVTPRQAELIVTLNRTIDAQLTILRGALAALKTVTGFRAESCDHELRLADAILGDPTA